MRRGRGEAGFTLIELLVSMTMGVVVLGAVGSLVVSAMKDQPRISERAQDINTARWVLERLTREIRNGKKVDKATASSVSFETYVRHSTCGGSTFLAATSESIKCEVTYTCSAVSKACTRIEAAPGVYTGTAKTIFEGIDSSEVFSYVPSAKEATFVKITLQMPNPAGDAPLTISDGASLRNATLLN
ncbi:MAG TPA: prepilin-type N-terminal cleavage/methylation domain-containing protein [Solirubrobacterales bacterium]